MDTTPSVMRRRLGGELSSMRPVSCFVLGATAPSSPVELPSQVGESIRARAARLRQSGEEDWKRRVQREDDNDDPATVPVVVVSKNDNDSAVVRAAAAVAAAAAVGVQLRPKTDLSVGARANFRSGVGIQNRLSSLFESANGWRERVPIATNDALKHSPTVRSTPVKKVHPHSHSHSRHSHHHNTNATPKAVLKSEDSDCENNNHHNDHISSCEEKMDPSKDPKVTLRGTPRKLGLPRCTLNESALTSISSKLNSVLGAGKSPMLGGPPKKKTPTEPSHTTITTNTSETLTAAPIPPAPRPDPPKFARRAEPRQEDTGSAAPFLRPDDEESFGQFFAHNKNLDTILGSSSEATSSAAAPIHLDSLTLEGSSKKLLVDHKKSRVQGPKRRAAPSKNPIRNLQSSSITVDSYTDRATPKAEDEPKPSRATAHTPQLAISALAGLSATEDFKSVANKLRNTTASTLTPSNDAWRNYDLKNSLQSKMLLLIKGRRHAQVRLVSPTWRSLSLSDSFILVTKESVFAFVGPFSNIIERTKCLEVVDVIRKRRELCLKSTPTEHVLIDGHDAKVRDSLMSKLQKMLSELEFDAKKDADEWKKRQAEVSSNFDEDDEFYEEAMIGSNMVYRVKMDESKTGNPVELAPIEAYWGRSPKHQMLNCENVYIFDFGTELYIWIGREVSNLLRKKSVESAKELFLKGYDYSELDLCPFGSDVSLKASSRPEWAWFSRINQNMEPVLFKQKFFSWPAFTLTRSVKAKLQKELAKNATSGSVPPPTPTKRDLSEQFNLFAVDAKAEMLDKRYDEPNLNLELVSLGRGADDIIRDEDGLEVKIVSLDVKAFHIDADGERCELLDDARNYLFTGESYYFRWKYRLNRISRALKNGGESRFGDQQTGRERLCYFLWQGRDACSTQRGATALNAVDKLREEGAFQVSIENGREEPAFLRIFAGQLCIQRGKRSARKSPEFQSRYRMFAVKTTDPKEQFLVECACTIKNLRSRASFVFMSAACPKVYVWNGCSTNQAMKQASLVAAKILIDSQCEESGFANKEEKTIVQVDEGSECAIFMMLFDTGSTADGPTARRTTSSRSNLNRELYHSLTDDQREFKFSPRLFHFTSDAGTFQAKEVVPTWAPAHSSDLILEYPFDQLDLYDRAKSRPTFFLLDNHYEVYLWESKFPFFLPLKRDPDAKSDRKVVDLQSEIVDESQATTGSLQQRWLAERKCALETTLAYCHAKNAQEPPKAVVISAGLEPAEFIALFPEWQYFDNVAQLHIEDGRHPGEQILVQEILAQIRDVQSSNYSFEILKKRPLPEGINVLCLESYLDDAEFEKVFCMTREDYYCLPTWRQRALKQEKELF